MKHTNSCYDSCKILVMITCVGCCLLFANHELLILNNTRWNDIEEINNIFNTFKISEFYKYISNTFRFIRQFVFKTFIV